MYLLKNSHTRNIFKGVFFIFLMTNQKQAQFYLDLTHTEKGVGIAVKQAAKSYLTHHHPGAQATISDKSSNSSRVEIYLPDSELPRFNSEAFLRSLQNSGRLPTDITLHPKMSLTEAERETPSNPQDSATPKYVPEDYERLVKTFTTQLEERDSKIDDLELTLLTTQEELQRERTRLSELEKKSKSTKLPALNSATESVTSFLVSSRTQGHYLQSIQDYPNLVILGKDALRFNGGESELEFVNLLAQRDFKTSAELQAYLEEEERRLEERYGSEIVVLKEKLRGDNAKVDLLEEARKRNVTQDVLEVLLPLVTIAREEITGLTDQLNKLQLEKGQSEELFYRVKKLDKIYLPSIEAVRNSRARRNENASYPVLLTELPGMREVGVYIPFIGENEFDSTLISLLSENGFALTDERSFPGITKLIGEIDRRKSTKSLRKTVSDILSESSSPTTICGLVPNVVFIDETPL